MTTQLPVTWRNRIVGHGEEAPDQLLAHPDNWRIHPKAQQDALAGVLSEVGFIQNIIVNKRTGRVVDGHLRVMLAMRQSVPAIPVVYVDLSEEEERLALATLDPIAAMAATDKEKIAGLLDGLGRDFGNIDGLLAEVAAQTKVALSPKDGLTDPDAVPEPPAEPISLRGDIWLCGEHRVMCGDATSAEDVTELMGNLDVGVFLTDPPYGIGLDTDWSGIRGTGPSLGFKKGIKGNKYDPVVGDDRPFDPAPLFDLFACDEMFLFGADYYADRIPDRNDGCFIVWDKRKESQADGFGSEFELIWSRARHKRRILRHDWFGFLSASSPREAHGRLHPTQKPSSLFVDILTQWPGVVALPVVDPFLGSGTTLIAAERLGRVCYSMEIEPRYVDVAVRRWANFTGKEPIRG